MPQQVVLDDSDLDFLVEVAIDAGNNDFRVQRGQVRFPRHRLHTHRRRPAAQRQLRRQLLRDEGVRATIVEQCGNARLLAGGGVDYVDRDGPDRDLAALVPGDVALARAQIDRSDHAIHRRCRVWMHQGNVFVLVFTSRDFAVSEFRETNFLLIFFVKMDTGTVCAPLVVPAPLDFLAVRQLLKVLAFPPSMGVGDLASMWAFPFPFPILELGLGHVLKHLRFLFRLVAALTAVAARVAVRVGSRV